MRPRFSPDGTDARLHLGALGQVAALAPAARRRRADDRWPSSRARPARPSGRPTGRRSRCSPQSGEDRFRVGDQREADRASHRGPELAPRRRRHPRPVHEPLGRSGARRQAETAHRAALRGDPALLDARTGAASASSPTRGPRQGSSKQPQAWAIPAAWRARRRSSRSSAARSSPAPRSRRAEGSRSRPRRAASLGGWREHRSLGEGRQLPATARRGARPHVLRSIVTDLHDFGARFPPP